MQFKLSIQIDKSHLLSAGKNKKPIFQFKYLYPGGNYLTSKF